MEHCKKSEVLFEELNPNLALRKAAHWFNRQKVLGAGSNGKTVKRAANGEDEEGEDILGQETAKVRSQLAR